MPIIRIHFSENTQKTNYIGKLNTIYTAYNANFMSICRFKSFSSSVVYRKVQINKCIGHLKNFGIILALVWHISKTISGNPDNEAVEQFIILTELTEYTQKVNCLKCQSNLCILKRKPKKNVF